MAVAVAALVAFTLPVIFVWSGVRKVGAWLASAAVMPAFVLFADFVLPDPGGGASLFPVDLIVGGVLGAVAGGLGTLLGGYIRRVQGRDLS